MIPDEPTDQKREEWAIFDLSHRVASAHDRMIPITLLVMFGFTPIAQLILHLPIILTFPSIVQSMSETYLVYVIPALFVWGIWQFRQRRKVKNQQRLDKLIAEYQKKWIHTSVIDK